MGPNELMKVLDGLSNRLHDCGSDSFIDDEEHEAWRVACGAVDTLRMIVRERMSKARR
jgi:hypothetical protein